MSPELDGRDPVEKLAESFVERWRAGECPSIEEYAANHPEHAERIADLFPALLALEDLGTGDSANEDLRAAETEAQPMPRAEPTPRRLGEYRLVREIGRGGMGIVYEAEQESLGRRVALKVLPHRVFADDIHLKRFQQEARSAARLHHANIVPIFGVGADGGVHYYAMQFISGESLDRVLTQVRRLRLHRGAASPAERDPGRRQESATAVAAALLGGADSQVDYCENVARIGWHAAEALAYAHGEGVLHRDVKPANLLVDTSGDVWIADFGLAKAIESDDLTASGNVVGTLRYMPPERFNGVADAAGDVYGLGVTLYELLTLRPAFDAIDRTRLIQDVTHREPPLPRRIDPSLPRDLETIVLKATAKDSRDRYPTAAALADDLRRYLNHEPVAARRLSTPARLIRWCQRNPAVTALSAAIVLLAVTLVISGTVSAVKLRDQRDATLARLRESKLAEGRAWRTSRVVGQRLNALRALEEASQAKHLSARELRSEIIGSLALTDLEVISSRSVPEVYTVVSPGLARRAIIGADGGLEVYQYDADEPLATLPVDDWFIYHTKFSPSARYVLGASRKGPIAVWDIDAGRLILKLPAPASGLAAAFQPDERAVAAVNGEGSLNVRALPGGEFLRRDIATIPGADRLEYSPDGHRIAVTFSGPQQFLVHIYDVASATLLGRLHHSHWVAKVAWHPHGDLLAAACRDFKVHVWDTRSMRRLHVLEGHMAEVNNVAFSPDGRLLGSSCWSNRACLWDPRSGTLLVQTFGQLSSFSRDSGRLGFAIGRHEIGAWRIVSGDEYRVLGLPSLSKWQKNPQEIRFSSDSRWLLAISGQLGVRIWSVANPERAVQVDCFAHSAIFDHDGRSVLISADTGLFRWSIRERPSTQPGNGDGGGNGAWTVGPPEYLGIRGQRLSLDGDGRVLAIIQGGEVGVYELARPGGQPAAREIDRYVHASAHRVDVSRSGRWVVSSPWHGSRIVVRDVARREMAVELPSRSAQARFSPDERWLAFATGPSVRVHDTSTWKPHLTYSLDGKASSSVAFSADSRLFAFSRSRTTVEVCSIATGESIAIFEAPDYEDKGWLEFHPDGSLLATASPTRHTVKIWNLRAIRRTLRDLKLDWEPPLSPARVPAPPNALVVDPGNFRPSKRRERDVVRVRERRLLEAATAMVAQQPTAAHLVARAEIYTRLNALEEAIADLGAALRLAPEDVHLLEHRARLHRRRKDPEAALADLDHIVAILEGGTAAGHPADEPLSLDDVRRVRSEILAELAARRSGTFGSEK